MSRKIIAVRPADLNPDEVEYFQVGTLLVNTLEGDLYIVLDKEGNGVKKAYLVGGSAKYEILHHASLSHVIQTFDPVKFDESTVWYNTDMLYVKPLDGGSNTANAYISVRAELSPGVFGWKTILPISSAKNVYITKNPDGTPYTLQNYIDDHKKTLISPPRMNEAERGEIYIKESDNTLWWKNGNEPQDQVILGDANPYVMNKLKKSIHIMHDHPANWDPQSLWLKEGTDAGIVDALSTMLYASDPIFSGGLKFKDLTNKTGIARTAYDKIATIDLNNTQETGFQLFNFEFGNKDKYYIELYIEDKEEKLQLLFFNKRPEDSLSDFGNQLDQASMYISSTARKVAGNELRTDFKWDKKTIFLTIDTLNKKIGAGFVLDDGTLRYVYNNNITYITKFMGIGSRTSTTANAKSIVKINTFKVAEIPLGYKGLNNTLPDETAFTNIAPVTNAQSVFLERNQSLNALHQGGGRLITTPRDYLNKNSSMPGELMTDYTAEILYAKKPDGTIFKVGGGNDTKFLNHVNNSMLVIHGDLSTTRKEEENLSKTYILERDIASDVDQLKVDHNIIYGNMAVIDNSPDGNEEYKVVIPYTDSTTSYHKWTDIRSGAAKSGQLKVYLDVINDILKDNLKTKSIYRGINELINTDDLQNRFNTRGLFFTELKQNNARFSANSIYLQPIKKKGQNNVADRPELTILYSLFNVPEQGHLVIFKDDKNQMYITLYTESGDEYYGYINTDYSIRWDKKVAEKGGMVSLNSSIASTGDLTINNIQANSIEASTKLDTPLIVSGTHEIVKVNVNAGGNSASYDLGDKNTTTINSISKSRPTWTMVNTDGSTTTFNSAMIEDLNSSWQFKGELFTRSNNNLVDLNTLNNDINIGYYILTSSESKKNKNYPEDNKKGYLYVMKSGNIIVQSFVNMDDTKVEYCARTFDGTTWSKWNKTLTADDLTDFYKKTGGPISGNVDISKSLSVAEDSSLRGDITLGSTVNIKTSDNKNVIKSENNNNKLNLILGEKEKYETVDLESKTVPRWSTIDIANGNTPIKYNFALEKDLLALANNTYTKRKVDDLIAGIDFTPINNAIAERMKKTGDTGTGNYTFNGGEVKAEMLNMTTGTLRLPSSSLNSNNSYTDNLNNDLKTLFAQDKVKKGISMVDNLYTSSRNRVDTGVSTVVFSNDVSQATKSNNRISSILLNVSSDDGICVGTITGMQPNTLTFRRMVERNDIVDNLESIDATKVLSSNQGRILYNLSDTRYRGFLKLYYTGNTYDSAKLYALEPGNYGCNEADDLVRLGLDPQKISIPGNLVVSTANSTQGKVFTYLPFTDKANLNDISMAFLNMNFSNKNASKWIYIKDYSLFVDKVEMTNKLKKLRETILGYVVTPTLSYTGNSSNNSLPYRLVHIHNHNGSNVSDNTNKLNFYTNIDLSDTGLNSENALVQIKLRGYSHADSSPIEIICSINLKDKLNMSIDDATSDITYLTPGGIEVSVFVDSVTRKLAFSVFSDKGHLNLTFDTYIRISRMNNYSFDPAIVKYDYNGSNPSNSTKVDLENTRYLFTNS